MDTSYIKKLLESLGGPLSTPGFELPEMDGMLWEHVGDLSEDNWIGKHVSHENGSSPLDLSFRAKARGNVVLFGPGSKVHGSLLFEGSNNLAVFAGENPYRLQVTLYFSGFNGCIFLGKGSTSNSVTAWTHGVGTSICIGEDAMIAHSVIVRTSDDHAIIDLQHGTQTNPPASIVIEPHVWLCPEVHILKGGRVGYGSIIGERSVVTGTVARCVLAAGVPARVIRTNVSWDRPLMPRPGIHEVILKKLSLYPPAF